jgi:chromosome segregation ATPase
MAEDDIQTVEKEPTTTAEESQEPSEAPPEERIAELASALGGLAERDARIQGLVDAQARYEQRIVALEDTLRLREARTMELDAALEEAEASLNEREVEIERVGGQLAQAVAVYRTSLLAAEPEILEEMVQGTTVEEIEASLARARQMVEQVRTQLEAQASQQRVPFGAPVRSAPDLSGLSPQEKILLGLSRR